MTESNTGYYAEVVAHSKDEQTGSEIVTPEVCFPRFLLPEFNTHRVFSRNSASSRAIPVAKQLERIDKYPFVPEAFPINKPGMSATDYLYPGDKKYHKAERAWLKGRDNAVKAAKALLKLDIHKQTANRVLEPYMWHSVVFTTTELENFYNLRISPHAQPEINKIAEMIKDVIDLSTPKILQPGQWHLPYIDEDDIEAVKMFEPSQFTLPRLSAGRCAAVTLLNQSKKNIPKDLQRTDILLKNGHMSPLEHPAVNRPGCADTAYGNFAKPWLQLRKYVPGENIFREGEERSI